MESSDHPATPVVTRAEESDRQLLESILAEVFLADHAPYIPEPLDRDSVAAYSRDLVSRCWQRMALARVDDQTVGMAYVEGDKVEALNIAAGWKRRGVGAALLRWAEGNITASGHRVALVDTQSANAPARAFYETMGYHVIRHWPLTAFTAVPIPMVTMSKSLSGANAPV
ncbi:MAG TPA: GNAT family N-acetyltransferase [Phycisphaerae bacterium]|jgi:GNAT superfamily N-acetyltransferase